MRDEVIPEVCDGIYLCDHLRNIVDTSVYVLIHTNIVLHHSGALVIQRVGLLCFLMILPCIGIKKLGRLYAIIDHSHTGVIVNPFWCSINTVMIL